MDADYGRNRDRDGGSFTTYEPSLFVWATVMSHPAEDRAFVDAGLKAPPVRFIDMETDRLGSDDDPRRDAVPGRRYSFGTPALRSPVK